MPNKVIFKNRVVSQRDATRESSNFIEIFKDANSKRIRYLNTLNQSKALIGSTFGHTYFVSPGGDDILGEVGNIVDTFKTISAARDKAVNDGFADSLVYVYPGTYNEIEIQYGTHALPGSMYLSPGTLIQPDLQINGVALSDVIQDDKIFEVNEPLSSGLPGGSKFEVYNTTGNDGFYTVASTSESGGKTTIIVEEDIPDPTVDGALSTYADVIWVGQTPRYAPISSTSTNFSLYGEGIIHQRETMDASPDWPGSCIRMSDDATAIIKCTFDSLLQDQGMALYANDGTMTASGRFIQVTTDGYCGTFRETADVTVTVARMINNGTGWPFFIRPSSDTPGNYFSGRVILNADIIQSSGGWQTLAFARVGLGGVCIINCAELISENSYVLAFIRLGLDSPTSTARIEINGNSFVTGTGPGVYNSLSTGGSVQINGNVITQSARIFEDIYGGSTPDNVVYINGDMEVVAGSADSIEVQTGALRLNGSLKNNGVGSDGINITGAGELIIDTLKIICDGESITAGVARDAIVNFKMASNKAANANITFIGPGSIGIDSNCK